MSGYRSLKRVLGESNLERKCRWLFGVCVGGLIILAFYSVGRIAENLIDDTAQYKGRGVARVELFRRHWEELTDPQDPNYKKFVTLQKRLVDELDRSGIERRMLKWDDTPEPRLAGTPLFLPESDAEREILRQLRSEAEERIRKAAQAAT